MQINSIKNEGSWIFISHSSKDIEKIRLIRNEFEKWGQNPLAFHLKCLNTDTEDNEKFLFDLIKKEIEARNWFVYCESESALNSKYVQLEREYVQKVGKVQIWKLDLNEPIEDIVKKIKIICTRLQVFISYAHKDYYFVQDLILELKTKDFSVWDESQLAPGSLWEEKLINNLLNISREGFFLSLLTENSINSEYFWKELRFAKDNNALIIILIIGDKNRLSEKLFSYSDIGGTNYGICHIPCIPKKEDMYLISDIIYASLKAERSGMGTTFNEVTRNMENKIQEKLNYEKRFHPEKPVYGGNTGARGNYCEWYKFPCCNTVVLMGDSEPSQYRFDGCKK